MKRIYKITLGFSCLAYFNAANALAMVGNEVAMISTPTAEVASTDVVVVKHHRHHIHKKSHKVKQSTPKSDSNVDPGNWGTILDKDAAINHAMEGHGIIPFATVEGFPVWINFGGITVTKDTTTNTADSGTKLSGGFRIGGGFLYPYKSNVDLSAEAAWNYFGSTSGKISANRLQASLCGVDFLIGGSYKKDEYEWFAKMGVLFERLGYNFEMPNTYIITVDPQQYYLTLNSSGATTDVLPEIKVGLNYNYNTHWAFSGAYMHAFGDTPSVDLSSLKNGNIIQADVNTSLRGASLNSILFGVRYRFVNV